MNKSEKKVFPFFSVIVPAYNCEKYISKCLESIINQSFFSWEVVVVNDGSVDNTINILNNYLEKDNRIKVINKENGGVSSARNVALNYVSGQYVLFLDSDDWYELNYFENLYEILKNKKADIIFSTQYYINESQLIFGGKNSTLFPQSVIDLLTKFTYSFAMSCIKRNFLNKDLRFCENLHFYEDGELLTRILSLHPIIAYNENPSFHYRQGSDTHTKFTYKTLSQIDTLEIINNRFRGKSIKMNLALNRKFVSSIAGMTTIASMDNSHDSKLDNLLMRFSRKHICKILFSFSKITFVIKCILVAISPQIAYKTIRLMIGGRYNDK